ncbi:guanine deaminase [Gottschalkia purinilytica]|uniref:Guanine deaminase n=1 Tax=Gottschalkia purinilytica TaxID=1503 RepID=A0A0L0WF37_GOTPU|nr:amidohydrolase family protein [Gottschalkia purinilytica]KNF10102.1 guanine deaminase [Gottschalkia purinilytica]
MSQNIKVYKGNIVFTKTPKQFTTLENGYIIVENGKVKEVTRNLSKHYKNYEIFDYDDKIIIPGFVDIHLHAPQLPNNGLGLDKELLPWLEAYTYPEEARYGNMEYAKKIYPKLIKDLWKYGVTRSVIMTSIHKETTELLIDLFIKSGLSAYIGKVNMDRNANKEVLEDTKTSIKETEKLIKKYIGKSELVKPILTPTLVPICTPEIMKGIGQLAKKYDLPVQAHLSENRTAVEWVRQLHPEQPDFGSVYNEYGLFGQQPTVMAHCIYTTDNEIKMMQENKIYVAHCPHSNFNLASGIMPLRKYLNLGIDVGLGSDISAGHTLSMMSTIVSAIQASKIKWVEDSNYDPISVSEGFYLATKGGGKFFGKVGSFEEGYDFDAIIIDDDNLYDFNKRTLEGRIEKFIYTGDDRNIVERFVAGKKIEEPNF